MQFSDTAKSSLSRKTQFFSELEVLTQHGFHRAKLLCPWLTSPRQVLAVQFSAVVEKADLDHEQLDELALHAAHEGNPLLLCVDSNVDTSRFSPARRGLFNLTAHLEERDVALSDALVSREDGVIAALFVPNVLESASVSAVFGLPEGKIVLRFGAPNDMMRKKVVYTGDYYESAMLEHIRRNYRGGDIVDAGANIGNHTVFFGKMVAPESLVFAFEPNDEVLECLAENVAQNGVEAQVVIHKVGLGDEPGRAVRTGGGRHNLGAARYQSVTDASMADQAIQITTLDAVLPCECDVAVLKIDVEGFDLRVLRGARSIVERCRPEIYVEAANTGEKDRIIEFLKPFGYSYGMRFNDTPTHWLHNAR